ncbi:hypothetical protein V6N12_049850 [Hibiscus sabdariffa]|uniref:Uncharacterized protein n=1 Tax=Hibiscus sabdariffa TaxID=183260 RepID=A0ABR2GAX1_9ROSI
MADVTDPMASLALDDSEEEVLQVDDESVPSRPSLDLYLGIFTSNISRIPKSCTNDGPDYGQSLNGESSQGLNVLTIAKENFNMDVQMGYYFLGWSNGPARRQKMA